MPNWLNPPAIKGSTGKARWCINDIANISIMIMKACSPFESSFGVFHAQLSLGVNTFVKTSSASSTDCQNVRNTTNFIEANFNNGLNGRSSIRIV